MQKNKLNRREFVAASAGAGALAASHRVFGQSPAMITSVKPIVVAAGNGNRSKDAAGLTCVAKAFNMITSGKDVLDAVVAGVNIVELDPEDSSVGYGGLPNAGGGGQLDPCLLRGATGGAGG